MWKNVESTIKPSELDMSSDSSVVYVRKNIKKVKKEEDTVYQYEENEIPKEDWELYQKISENTNDISDVQDALIELAEIIVGE